MKNLEDFIAKDRVQTTNKDMFETICALAEKRKRENTPKGLSVVVAVLCCIVVTLSVFNVFATYDKTTAQTALHQESEEFQVFAQDNYFDILSDYYPEELIQE